MHPSLDDPAWGGLTRSERERIATRIAEGDAIIAWTIAYEARRSLCPPQMRMTCDRATFGKLVAEAEAGYRNRSRQAWVRQGLGALVASALLGLLAGELAGAIAGLIAGMTAVTTAALGMLGVHRRTRDRIAPEALDGLLATAWQVAVLDAEVVHVYSIGPRGDTAVAKRWPIATLRRITCGDPVRPGLVLGTSQRQIHLALARALDGNGENEIGPCEAEATCAALYGQRYVEGRTRVAEAA